MAMTFDEWTEYGWKQGWCGPPLCLSHDGFPMSDQELGEFDEGGDPCQHFIRLYEDETNREAIEETDSPTNWRASNRGWKRG